MKLLSEKEIEEATKERVNMVWFQSSQFAEQRIQTRNDFKAGALFNEQKLISLMVEFAEWIRKQNRVNDWDFMTEVEGWSIEKYTNDDCCYTDFKTTQQLLEQFIDYKHKQEETTEKVK